MLSSLFIHTISVTRFTEGSQDSLGAFSAIPATLELPCRVEQWQEKAEYRESNVREVAMTTIYSTVPLRDKDHCYWGSKHPPNVNTGDYIGVVSGVNPALRAGTTTLDHYESSIESP